MKYIYIILLASLVIAPGVAFAVENLKELVSELISIVNAIIPLLFSVVLVGFIWGIIKYLFSADVTKLKDARKYIVFSVVAIAVMMSIWSIALFLKNSFFPSAVTPFNSGPAPATRFDNPGPGGNTDYARNTCAADYTTGRACNHGQGPGICSRTGECVVR